MSRDIQTHAKELTAVDGPLLVASQGDFPVRSAASLQVHSMEWLISPDLDLDPHASWHHTWLDLLKRKRVSSGTETYFGVHWRKHGNYSDKSGLQYY
jgi:hypothetical protein